MAAMSSTEPSQMLDAVDRTRLLEIARDSINTGLDAGHSCDVDLARCSQALRLKRATFVTLELDQQLRGCIGTLEARRPLATDVAENAWSAAFQDPRFGPVTFAEAESLEIAISVLSPPQPLPVADEEDLLEQLRPGVDGLVIEGGHRHATFLPSVWESLLDPYVFLSQLRSKAGFPLDYWSEQLTFKRYTTETFRS